MAKSILTSLDLQSLPALDTPRNGSINFAAKSDGLYQKIGTSEEKLLTTNESSYIPLVIGTQTATTASWAGVLDADSLKSGQTIRYWLPRTSASGVTLNLTLKGGTTTGAIPCYYGGTTRLTTHYPAGSFIMMTYLEGALINGTAYTGWWAKANYADGTESYTVRWNAAIKAGAQITRYKLLVQGSDGRYYPTTIGNTTAGTKTISTVPFLIGSPIIFYSYTTTIAAGGVTSASYNYTGITTSNTTYTWNKVSGWRANEDVYLKGTISGALFTLDNTTLTSHMTQDLPTTEDGFYYMRLGMFTNTTTGFRLSNQHPTYYFADGELQSLNTSNGADWEEVRNKPDTFTPSSHKHPTTDITGLGNIATINKNSSTSNYLRGDGTWVTPPNKTYGAVTTSANGLMIAADKVKLNGIEEGANKYVHPSAHPISFITGLQGALDGKSNTGHTHSYLPLSREYVDRRTIIPTSIPSKSIQFGFTSLNINSTSPYADFMDLGGYTDSSGGKKNLILFNKGNFGIRQYQGTFGAASYSGYVDYFHTGNLTSLSQLTDNIGVATHIANTSNPHNVTKAQVGLGNVDNTADSAKNVLSATKLTTARNINGTSFNGTAAITTANWGTARTLSFTGDVTGSSSVNGSKNVATAMTLANSGVTAGTYRSVTVDAKGRVTAGTNPTTVSGYGLTDAVTTNTTQSITGTKTFTKRIGANLGIKIGTHSTDGLIEWDATNNAFKFNGSLYATGGISALGLGSEGGSSGGGADMLDSWANYTTAKANYYVPASLGIGLYNDKVDKSNFQIVTSLPTSPTAGVFYFIKE